MTYPSTKQCETDSGAVYWVEADRNILFDNNVLHISTSIVKITGRTSS